MDVSSRLADATNFPWLLSNVLDGKDRTNLSNSLMSKIIEWKGVKIGLMGLAEKEWIDTLPNLPEHGCIYVDFISEAERIAASLREEGAQIVIALTHMREPNDIKLAKTVEGVDLILGGHDHFYNVTHVEVILWTNSISDPFLMI